MLKYSNGRFHSGSISFALPDNCFLVIAEALNYFDNGLELTSEEDTFHITISTQWEDSDAKTFLDSMIVESGFHRLSDTCPIVAGELPGYYAVYEDVRNRYCEYRFDIIQRDEVNSLSVYVYTDKSFSSEDIREIPMLQELLRSLKAI